MVKNTSRCSKKVYAGYYLIILLFAGFLSACGEDAGLKTARVIAESMNGITKESKQWREEWQKTRTELPADIREQFDLAFTKALDAAGAEVRCNTDFIRSRLKTDLRALVALLKKQKAVTILPHVCSIYPNKVIRLKSDLTVKTQPWISFSGYDFIDAKKKLNVKILLESTDGNSRDITNCCVDSPNHYSLTVDFDEVHFLKKHRRLVLYTNTGKKLGLSVAINHAQIVKSEVKPFPKEYWTSSFSEEGTGEETCKSGYAVAGVSCYGKKCDDKKLLCRPYMATEDRFARTYWHPQVISEEQPHASFRTDKLSPPGLVKGLRCTGGYCDNISFNVVNTSKVIITGLWRWKPFFSEESPGSSICNKNQFVTGLGCKGSNCDNISIHCSTVRIKTP